MAKKGKLIEEKPTEPEQPEEQPEYDDLTGPELKVRYDTEDREGVLVNADPEFGPFLVIAFHDRFSAQQIPFLGNGLTLAQMEVVERQVALMRASIATDIGGEQVKRRESGLVTGKDLSFKPGPIPGSRAARRMRRRQRSKKH